MSLFSKRAAGLCWDTKGNCFGVLLKQEGSRFVVIDHWQEKTSNPDAIANALPKGARQFKNQGG